MAPGEPAPAQPAPAQPAAAQPAAAITLPSVLPVRRRTVTQDVINAWAELSGDHNPLHVDPDWARTTRYGRTIAHGFMSLSVLSAAVEEWLGGAWPDGSTMEAKFVAPVFADDELRTEGKVTAREELSSPVPATLLRCELRCLAYGPDSTSDSTDASTGGRVVIAADAGIVLPAAVQLTQPDQADPNPSDTEKGAAQ